MIFAAGLGTRLRPLTNDRPKALVEVNGKTLLEHNILKLKAAGADRIVVNVHHFGEQIISFLRARDNFGIEMLVSDERGQLMDTGGGIRQALPLLRPGEPVLIHNVDIVSTIDLRALYAAHLEHNPAGATLAVNDRKTSRYLMFDADDALCGWTNVSTGEVKGAVGEKHAFAGIHVIGSQVLEALAHEPEVPFSIIPFYLKQCRNIALRAYDVTASEWVDCGKVESLERAAQITS